MPCIDGATGASTSLAAIREREGRNATSHASAYDLLTTAPALPEGSPLRQSLERLLELQSEPNAFQIAPHLLTGCNHTLFGTPVALPFKLDELNEGRGERNPLFRSMANYCKLRRERRGPKCPPRSEHRPHLGRSQVFFAVLTTDRLVRPRGSVMARILRQQGADFAIYSDMATSSGARALPVSGHLERMAHNKSLRRASGLSFIAQKHLELLHTLSKQSAAQQPQPPQPPQAQEPPTSPHQPSPSCDGSKPHLADCTCRGASCHFDGSAEQCVCYTTPFTPAKTYPCCPHNGASRRRPPAAGVPTTRWWVILDDDSFVFVDRLVQTLNLIDDGEPLLVGGASARSHLCANGLCDFKGYINKHGYSPVVHALAGGVGYVFSDLGLRKVGAAIAEGRCLDATLGDLATAACARIAGVSIHRLPGGWMVNDGSIVGQMVRAEKQQHGKARSDHILKHEVIERASFTGQLLSVHKLPDRVALCWAEHGECDPRCDCACKCAALQAHLPNMFNGGAKAAEAGQKERPRDTALGKAADPVWRSIGARLGRRLASALGWHSSQRWVNAQLKNRTSDGNLRNRTSRGPPWLAKEGSSGAGGKLSSLRGCMEPAGATCDFECPPEVWLDDLRPAATPEKAASEATNSALSSDRVQVCV